MSETVGILVDIGNSETRFAIVRGNVTHDMCFSNRYVKLEGRYSVPAEYRNNKSTIICSGGVSHANGAIVDKEFPSKAIYPNALTPKTDQLTTYLTMNLVFIRTYMYLAEVAGQPIENIDVQFDIRLMLPPSEHDKRSDDIKAKIQGIGSVECLSPVAFKKPVQIRSIMVLPEGATAFIGSIYRNVNDTMVIEQENSQFTTGDVLVIDIGAGTTDIVHVKDTELVVDSKETFNKGCNNVSSLCGKKLYKQFDYYPGNKDMEEVLKSGVLVKGTERINVEEHLNAAKESFGNELKNFLIGYIERNDIEIRSIKGLLVVGGGALAAERDGVVVSPSIADVLVKYIKELTSSVSLVSLKGLNPRSLNLEGLKLYYKFT